jgi:hypothetical protein
MEKETYSYSKLSTWADCKAAYNLVYNKIPRDEQTDSFFGVLGKGCHQIMEDLDNGEHFDTEQRFMEAWQEADAYPAHYDAQTSGFIKNAYFKKLVKFFKKVPPQSTPLYKAEQEILIPIGDFMLKGFIDRVGDNGRILVDYKTNNPAGDFWDMDKKLIQLYLYAGWVKRKFGYFPEKLIFWFIRYNDDPKRRYHIETFNKNKFDKAIQWAKDMVAEIRQHKGEYETKPIEEVKESLFCQVICGVREHCIAYKENDKLLEIQKKFKKKD